MFNKIILIFILIFFSISISFTEETVDLNQLTIECVEASKRYKTIQNDFAYKVLHTVQYEGWSGDSNTFELAHPVKMTIRYAGASKEGYYWFQKNLQKKYKVTAKSDIEGNFELVEDIGDGFKNHTLRGLMKDGIIKGLWEKGNGKKAYAFYVKAIDEKTHNK
jgi:hypothetical protein